MPLVIGVDPGDRLDYLAAVVIGRARPQGKVRVLRATRTRGHGSSRTAEGIVNLAYAVAEGQSQVAVIGDATGRTGPIMEDVARRLREARSRSGTHPAHKVILKRIIVTGGDHEHDHGNGERSVPKLDIMHRLIVAVQDGGLDLSSCPVDDARDLVGEVESLRMQTTPSGKVTYNARSGAHDDLAFAAALALYGIERLYAPVVITSPARMRLEPTGASAIARARIERPSYGSFLSEARIVR